jgi:hypothetical protein
MSIRRILAALAVAGALLVAGAAPAFAAGPPVPAGCSFDQATGVLTCVTTTTTTSAIGPFSTIGAVPVSTTFDGVTGQQIVNTVFPGFGCIEVALQNATFSATFMTTTTTERHGLHGKVFDTSTSTSLTSLTRTGGGVGCETSL